MSMHKEKKPSPACNESLLTLTSSTSDLNTEPLSELNEGSGTSGKQAKGQVQKQEASPRPSKAKVRLNGKGEEGVDGEMRVDRDLYLLNL